MDKDKLLAHFQSHYLSRQEVLYKLPLNYSIDAFWPELLNRRKASAVILPLYNGTGMPYWYVLTDKMIAASERLCEEALDREGDFDPYRAQMTGAMTEEMFFTSFVEGAQIPLREAMDFLQRGTEPENIMEQMIWNNRRAWAELTATLYRSLDEGVIRNLAYLLTEGMDGCAEDYRQTDSHPIAAMSSEPYEVPPSYALPDMMRQYAEFLGNPEVHPLIKAAVAQAYLLVTRPFPEGNERLSRMISSAVLMRCGYDFFRDISISSVIAKESYRYYKAMREIIRMENGGDLTYFIEYFLELLVRSIDARNERLQKRETEALERERELAKTPLSREIERFSDDQVTCITCHVNDEERRAVYTNSGDCQSEEGSKETKKDEGPPGIRTIREYCEECERSSMTYKNQLGRFLRNLIEKGESSFTSQDLIDKAGMTLKVAKRMCWNMVRLGFVKNETPLERTAHYRFFAEDHSDSITARLKAMQKPGSGIDMRISMFLQSLLESKAEEFTSADWMRVLGCSKSVASSDIRRALNIGLIKIVREDSSGKLRYYSICTSGRQDDGGKELTEMQKGILSSLYSRFGKKQFTNEECADAIGKRTSTTQFHLHNLVEHNLLSQQETKGQKNLYSLLVTPQTHPECFPEKRATSRLDSYLGSPMPMAAMAG